MARRLTRKCWTLCKPRFGCFSWRTIPIRSPVRCQSQPPKTFCNSHIYQSVVWFPTDQRYPRFPPPAATLRPGRNQRTKAVDDKEPPMATAAQVLANHANAQHSTGSIRPDALTPPGSATKPNSNVSTTAPTTPGAAARPPNAASPRQRSTSPLNTRAPSPRTEPEAAEVGAETQRARRPTDHMQIL